MIRRALWKLLKRFRYEYDDQKADRGEEGEVSKPKNIVHFERMKKEV